MAGGWDWTAILAALDAATNLLAFLMLVALAAGGLAATAIGVIRRRRRARAEREEAEAPVGRCPAWLRRIREEEGQ